MPSRKPGLFEPLLAPQPGAGEHDAEQEQHHDRTDVHQHLRDGHELGGCQDVLRGDTGEHQHQPERGVHHVLGGDDAQRGEDHHRRDDPEGDVLRDVDVVGREQHDRAHFFWAPTSSSGASGTVCIHSPSLSLSWSRSAMRGSEYSYSGLQKSASNGHTSTQMPQYMHSA